MMILATSGIDFTAVASGEVVFMAGETAKDIEVDIIGDDTPEDDETFTVTLTGGFIRRTDFSYQ